MRILIAEDDPKLLKSLVHIFEMNHYSVDGVDNGNDAFDFASSDEYDGLVLDIMMPGMDGVTLLKKLRSNGITTPALFLTAKQKPIRRSKGSMQGLTIISLSHSRQGSFLLVSVRCFAEKTISRPICSLLKS